MLRLLLGLVLLDLPVGLDSPEGRLESLVAGLDEIRRSPEKIVTFGLPFERGQVPLVLAGDEILWVAGIRPAESRRIGPGTHRRLRLKLIDDAEGAKNGSGISEAG